MEHLKKLVGQLSNGGISSNAKRLCNNSPTGISHSEKRVREDGAWPRDSRKCLVLSDDSDLPQAPLPAEKENANPLHFFFFFNKNVVFPTQAEYSYFSADFRLKTFLYYS